MNGPVPVKSVSFDYLYSGVFAVSRLAPTDERAKGGPLWFAIEDYLEGLRASTPLPRGRPGGQRTIGQPVDPPPDRANVASRYGRDGVATAPSNRMARGLKGGFRSALQGGHDEGR